MPSTATTNFTIGPPLDLIGPIAATPVSDDGQPAFDSLLQSPPTPTTAPPESAADENSSVVDRAEKPVERRGPSASPQHVSPPHASPPQSSAEGNTGDSTSEAPSQAAHDPTQRVTPASAESSKPKAGSPKTESPSNDPSPQGAEPVVAESLAGLAAAAPVTIPVTTPAVVAEAQETKE